jgi:hypothetical protein
MNNKMGRPPLPQRKAKGIQVGLRVSPPVNRIIQQAAEKAEETKVEWLRNAAVEVAQFWVDGEGWTAADLDGKTVEFELAMPKGGILEGLVKGKGKFEAWQNGIGKMKIRILVREGMNASGQYSVLRIYLPQEGVKLIKRQPTGSACEFSVLDPNYQFHKSR